MFKNNRYIPFLIVCLVFLGLIIFSYKTKPTITTKTYGMPTPIPTLETYAPTLDDSPYMDGTVETSGWKVVGQNPTYPDWKTYENKTIGFRISAPDTYISEATGGDYLALHPPYKVMQPEGIDAQDIKIEFYIGRLKKNVSLEDLLVWEKHQGGPQTNVRITNLAGTNVIYQSWSGGGGTGETYIIIRNGYTLSIAKYPLQTVYQDEFNKIISTVTFF